MPAKDRKGRERDISSSLPIALQTLTWIGLAFLLIVVFAILWLLF